MKVSISLSYQPSRYTGYLGVILWFTGVCLMMTAAIIFINYSSLKEGYPRRVEQLKHVETELNDLASTRELPKESDLTLMRDRVQALNMRVALQGVGTIRLLDWLEENMPDNTYLQEFYHKRSEGEAVLIIRAANSNEFTRLLNMIEREPWFSEAFLSNNDRSRNEFVTHVQYELRVRLQ